VDDDRLLNDLAAEARVRAEYRAATPRSAEAWRAAMRVMPGGDTRASTFFAPHPLAVTGGRGSKITDLDGRSLTDFLNNYSALILGHAAPEVIAAVSAMLPAGTAFSAAHRSATTLARELADRVESIERVRFCNSGTEAAMWAVRTARAFTRRELVVKAYGGYHGSYDQLEQWREPERRGAPVLVVPYDDIAALRHTVAGHEEQIAAVILEPVLGSAGIFAASAEYLLAAEAICRRIGALLVLDEVITFRLGHGGAQGELGLSPDLTVLGKLIGGGFPVGAFGGREEVMDVFGPRPGALTHAGTFNGNPITMTAGKATLDRLDGSAFARLDELGATLAAGIEQVIARRALDLSVTRSGSLLQIHHGADPRPPRPGDARAQTTAAALHLALCLEGIHVAPRGFLNCSLAHDAGDIAAATEAFERAADRLAPILSPAGV
jgi:glutamate-1-semialdehyde 2,1-aminomutase